MNPRRQNQSDDDEEGDEEDKLLSEKRLEKRERESYKHSFLTKYMEKLESEEIPQHQTPKARKLPLTKTL